MSNCDPLCSTLCQLIGSSWSTHAGQQSGGARGQIQTMKCRTRMLSLFALVLGLLSCGTLSLAVATDYWLITEEPVQASFDLGNGTVFQFPMLFFINVGLWRGCFQYEQGGDERYMGGCFNINYGGTYGRTEMDQAETTWAIMRSMRKSVPFLVIALITLIVGFGFATVGNTRGDHKTLVGAVLYIFGALILALGVIFYISAVNDEVHHRKKPENPDDPAFKYSYGWAFFFGGSSFITSMITSVANITLYLKRFSNIEDMVAIIPGLEKKGNFSFSRENNAENHDESFDYVGGTQSPTVIL